MQLSSASVLPMVMKAAIELDLLEIMAKNDGFSGAQMSPSKLASHLPTNNPDAHVMLDRILRLLASHSILTCSDKVLMENWYHLKDAVLEGGIPFDKLICHSTIVMKKILEAYNGFE
ncbi:unnamed protein product [Eruca vesicaria subsp. sativa]|uniref:O-methyltransferase dimerisation domain-containing protein n=1 Tax=Eruca vesicaria subsp. sativa TaxID=29727 RepID=A0ABC8JDB2_ERUVS|nr:unnamed protein product [Eruca vesicaria subsp. sativa]